MENRMPKPILIIGTQGSGKSLAAKGISCDYKETKTINGKNWYSRTYHFQACTENTDCIIIDELISPNEVEYFYEMILSGVKVDRQSREPIVIYPQMVVILNIPKDGILRLQQAAKRRFDIIQIGGGNGK